MVAVLPARKVQAWSLSYWHNKITGFGYGCCPAGPKSPGMVVVLLAQYKKKNNNNNNNNNFCSFKSSDTFIALPGPSNLTTTQKQRCKRASNFIHKFNIQRRQSAQSLQGWPTAPNFTHRYQKYKSYPANLLKQKLRPAPSIPTAARAKLAPRREREKKKKKKKKIKAKTTRKESAKKKKRGGKKEEDGEDGTEVPRTLSNTTSPLSTPAYA